MGARISLKPVGQMLLWATAISTLNVPLAQAGDLTISDARTTPVDTATGDGQGPGTIIVDSAGSIVVGDTPIITVNSSHNVTSAGEITTTGVGVSGILIDTTTTDPNTNADTALDISSDVSNTGLVRALEPTDALEDTPHFNSGIRVDGLGSFTGNITNELGGVVVATGNSSYGISVHSEMVGNIVNAGGIQTTGKSAFGIMTTGHITGSISNTGSITSTSHQGTGVYIGGGLDGSFTNSGVISVGTDSQVTSEDGFNFTRIPALLGRNGVWIASDITGGVLLEGNRLTIDQEVADPAETALRGFDSVITAVGQGPGFIVTPGGPSMSVNNITIGALIDENGFSVVNRGNLLVSGAQGGVNAVGFDVEGVISGGTTYTSTLQGGFWNDGGDIRVSTLDASATAIRIGDHGIVPSIVNDGGIAVFTSDSTSRTVDNFVGELGGDGYALVVEEFGTLSSFENSGVISITVEGPTSSAYGMVDRSGTLTSFTNSGSITAVKPDGSNGVTVGVDFSSNTSGLSFANTGEITGDVLLGAGDQSVSMTGGTITGDVTFQAGNTKSGNNSLVLDGGLVTGRVSLGTGNHVVSITNGATLNGGLVQTGGVINLNMNQGQLLLFNENPINVSDANISAGSTLSFDIAGGGQAGGASILDASGQVTIGADTQILATVSGIIDESETYTIIRASTLDVGAPLGDVVTVSNSFMNNIDFSFAENNSNAIQVTVDRKSAEELGLGPNFSSIYNSFGTALNSDRPVAAALSSLQTQDEFRAGILQLLPDTSGATLQAALNNQDMGTGMIRRRLVAVAKSGLPNHAQGDVAGFWVQALGGYAEQDAKDEQAGFSVWGLGIALGADMPILDGDAHVGVSFMESWQSANLKIASNSPVEFFTSQLSAYGRHQNERFYTQATLTAAYNTYESMRQVEFGGLDRMAMGKWDGYQWGGSLETGTFFNWNLYQLAPYVRGTYVNIHEDSYTETLGGDGVNLIVGDKNTDSVRGSVGFTFDRDFPIFYDSYVETEFRANYTRDIINDPVKLTADFVAGDTPFAVTGNKRNPNRINMGFGVAHKDSYSSVSIDYDTEIASGYMSHTAALTARFRF